MGDEHIAFLEPVKLLWAGNHPRNTTRTAWTARCAHQHTPPVALLYAALEHRRMHG
jgi:hypothetical protein